MSKTVALMDDWKGMAPDNPRNKMSANQVWFMRDWLPRVLGSSLESRNAWPYWGTGVLNDYATAQKWVNTPLGPHHLALTPTKLYEMIAPNAPVEILTTTGALNPMAQQAGSVCIPRVGATPIFLRYLPGATTPTILATPGTMPQCRVAEAWNDYYVLANTTANPNRVHWVEWKDFTDTSPVNPIPAWDTFAWSDTDDEVTGLGRTRNALLVFHPGSVEKYRGSIPPGADREGADLWREPLVGLGGCREPHTICYWNDNVLFADARGAYLTDGTTIRDLTAQGGISREWRHTYQPQYRLSGGVYADFYLVAMVDAATDTFYKCYVCDLYSRNWMSFSNIPCTSFLTTTGQNEQFYGGTYNNRLIDLTRMFDDADASVDTVDGNGVAVLPQLETAWYRVTKDEAMRRIRNVFVSYDLSESTGHLKVYATEKVAPESADWFLLRDMTAEDFVNDRGEPIALAAHSYTRRRLPLGRESYGFAFKVETTGQIKNLKLFDFSVEVPTVREQTYAA